jgi:heme/copper-type cytochrome/quinol oxidase subunit 3
MASPLRRDVEFESATRVAVVAALSATAMLFASLASAYLVRRSFADWRASPANWPVALMAFAIAASLGIEVAAGASGTRRRLGLLSLALGSVLYLAGALAVIAGTAVTGLTAPFNAFLVLLLSLHVLHAILGGAFASWILRSGEGEPSLHGLLLARLVTHFLSALLGAILFLLFVL